MYRGDVRQARDAAPTATEATFPQVRTSFGGWPGAGSNRRPSDFRGAVRRARPNRALTCDNAARASGGWRSSTRFLTGRLLAPDEGW
jgi:hypothetical protein